MEMLTKETMTVQALIELAKLSVDQTIKYLDHANYQLRGSQMVVLDNLNIIDGAGYNSPLETQLMDMRSSELATVITTTHGIVYLKEDMVILIFKDGKPTYAMY